MKCAGLIALMVSILASCTVAPTPEATLTPQPTATETPLPTATFVPTPTQVGGGSGRFIFTMTKVSFIKEFPSLQGEQHIFLANANGSGVTPLTAALDAFNFVTDVSADAKTVLVSSKPEWKSETSSLYLVNLQTPKAQPLKIAEGLPSSYGTNLAAKWIDEGRLAFIGNSDAGFGIYLMNLDGSDKQMINKYANDGDSNKPLEILAIGKSRLYWDALVKVPLGGNRYNYRYFVHWSSLDGNETGALEYKGKTIYTGNFGGPEIGFSPDTEKVAWVEELPNHHRQVHIASSSDLSAATTIDALSGPYLMWWPNGSKVLVFDEAAISYQCASSTSSPWAGNDLCGAYTVAAGGEPTVVHLNLPNDILYSAPKVSGSAAAQAGSFYATQGLSLEFGSFSPDGYQIIALLPCQTEITLTKFSSGSGGYSVDQTDCERSIKSLNLKTMELTDILPGILSPQTSTGSHKTAISAFDANLLSNDVSNCDTSFFSDHHRSPNESPFLFRLQFSAAGIHIPVTYPQPGSPKYKYGNLSQENKCGDFVFVDVC